MAKSKRVARAPKGNASSKGQTRATRTDRARQREHVAREHGRIAREKTESRLTPQQKRARTIHARKLENEIRAARRSAAAKRGWDTRRGNAPTTRTDHARPLHGTKRTRAKSDRAGGTGGGGSGSAGASMGAIYSLSQIDAWDYDYGDPDDYIEYDVDTSPDYG